MTRRHVNVDWKVPETASGAVQTWDLVALCVLMDIRDELQSMNSVLGSTLQCHNTVAIPHTLARIDRRLQKQFGPLKGK